MSESIADQIQALQQSIVAMEAQRNKLGDKVVAAALLPLREKLAELEAQQLTAEAERQRKQVTVLFMDIAGSTQLVSKMDPEEAMDVFDTALERLGRVVEENGGRVTRYMGDGLLAVFGVPVAREDDPQRAVRAGLQLLAQAGKVGEELGVPGLAVRVGVNSGLVAVGGHTEAEDTLMGSAVNLAARLESAAPVGGVLISHETYRHVQGAFDIQAAEEIAAKGFAEPVRTYRVLRGKARAFRQPLRGVEGLETRMVGRDAELKYLQDALVNVLESGEGQVITVCGEAGVGKSRLLEEFQAWAELRPETMWLYQGRGRIEEQGLPYGLLREVFADRFEILEDDSQETVRGKLVSGLQAGWREQAEMKAHIVGLLLGYDFRDSPHLRGVSEGEQLRNRAMMYLGEYFGEMSRQRPVIMLLEDIHWADDSTLDAVNWLEERMDRLRMLTVCAGREALYERRPYWGEGEERHTRVTLKPLTRRQSRELVEDILRQVDHLPDDLRELIVENAEGNPFYVEELIKMLIEDGVIVKGETQWRVELERLQRAAVPSTLTGVLQARLDGLPPGERRVLQEASVVGRQFWDRVVAYVHTRGHPEAAAGLMQERLSSLRGRELIFRREGSAFAEAREYLFKHDLLREVTYEGVLRKVRQAHHGLVADWLIANASGRISEYAGLIGEHLVLGGRGEEAVDYLLLAGEAALAAHSGREAERFYRRALELKLPDAQQARTLAGLGKALYLQARREEAIVALQQGIELSRQLGDTDRLAEMVAQLSWAQVDHGDAERWQLCRGALVELAAAPASPGLARLLVEAGRAAFRAYQPADVITEYSQRAIEMAQRLGLVAEELEARDTATFAMDIQAQNAVLGQVALQAEAHGLMEVAARAYGNLGAAALASDDLETSLEYYGRSLELWCRAGNMSWALGILDNLAAVYAFSKPLDVQELVSATLNRISVPKQRLRELQRSVDTMMHWAMGNWAQALEISRLRLAEARKSHDLQSVLGCNFMIAALCIVQADLAGLDILSEAETALRENLDILQGNPDLGQRPMQLFRLAEVKALQGQLEEARPLLDKAEELLSGDTSPMATIEEKEEARDRAAFYLAQAEGSWEEALGLAQSLAECHVRGTFRWARARYLIWVGDALHGRDAPGDRGRARDAYQQALEYYSGIGADGCAQAIRGRLESLPAESA